MTSGSPDAARRPLLIPVILLIGGGAVYATAFSANRIAFEAGVPFISYSFWQALFGAVALIIVSLLLRALPQLSAAHIRLYTLTAIVGFGIPLVALTFVAGKLPAGILTLVVTLVPALTYAFAFLIRLERLRLYSIIGLVLGLAGVLLIVLPAGSVGSGFSPLWLLLGLVAPLGYALNNVAVPFLRPPATTSLQLSTGVLTVGAIVLLPVMLIVDGPVMLTSMPAQGILAVFWAATTNVVIFLCLFEIIRLAGPVFFSQFNYIVVAAGSLWAFLIFGDTFSPWVWAAIGTMAAGLVFGNMGANQVIRESQEPSAGD